MKSINRCILKLKGEECYVLGIPEICYVYVMVSDYYVMYAD